MGQMSKEALVIMNAVSSLRRKAQKKGTLGILRCLQGILLSIIGGDGVGQIIQIMRATSC